jgi:hypothetical protein
MSSVELLKYLNEMNFLDNRKWFKFEGFDSLRTYHVVKEITISKTNNHRL